MKGYLKFFSVLIFAAAVALVQQAILLVRGELPRIAVETGGSGSLQELLAEAARRGGAVVVAGAEDPAPDVLFVDEPFRPSADAEEPAPAGPFDPTLDRTRDAALAGTHVVVGFRCLAETSNPRLARELAWWTGSGEILWIGTYASDLGKDGAAPGEARAEWERRSGRPWDFSGAGIVLQSPATGEVLVLRRGVELERDYLSVEGSAAGIRVRALLGGRFVVAGERSRGETVLRATFGLSPEGAAVAARSGVPTSFPLVGWTGYGSGRVWTFGMDAAGTATTRRPRIGGVPAPGLDAARTLDEPTDSYARFARLLVPAWRAVCVDAAEARAAAASPAPGQAEFRAGDRYLERRLAGGDWEPWFPKGVNLGGATPGHWTGDPPVDEETWAAWLDAMADAGFDAVRVYTLLPPAFYRALAAHDASSARKLYLFQEIWPEEDAPGHDLGSPEWLEPYMAESDTTIGAVYGEASVPERSHRAWGEYRADASPWLAAILVGRELLPEEVIATARTRPDLAFSGRWFSAEAGHPVESLLASMAERAAERMERAGGPRAPVGFVSWPTLDAIRHPSEWTAGSAAAPYNDRATVDLRAVSSTPENEAGFFAAFHVYPNYPDFMIRSKAFELPGDADGTLRYAAYLDQLLGTLPGIPLVVAEFGLATGFGTAHLHPEGLHHGGLDEEAQARGLVALFRTIAARGAAGGIVFEWADEWAKKTWTTETYTIPFDRNPLWLNAIDPEQNYGIRAWRPAPGAANEYREGELRAGEDPEFLRIGLPAPPAGVAVADLGIDVVPGRTGEYRLAPEDPAAPQGSEFLVHMEFTQSRLTRASLLVQPSYDRGQGKLFPAAGARGSFARIRTLVNRAADDQEGRASAALWEDGSELPIGPRGLAEQAPDGAVSLRIPWSRLNFSDPSGRRILLDPIRDARGVLERDALATAEIRDLGFWFVLRGADGKIAGFMPDRSRAFRFYLRGWESVQAAARPKLAYAALSAFLPSWDPLAERAVNGSR